MEPTVTTSPVPLKSRTLVLMDWKADPHAVLAGCAARPEAQQGPFDLVVTAALHGIHWVGDPYANLPCAGRALEALTQLLVAAGLRLASSAIGDHDPVAAAVDATLSQPIDQILVCGLKRHVGVFDLGDRISRATHLPVLSLPVPAAGTGRRVRSLLQGVECGATDLVNLPRTRSPGGPATTSRVSARFHYTGIKDFHRR